MTDPRCQRFFTGPTQILHQRYEILRAHFVEQRSLTAIAAQSGLNYYTVRALVRTFRAQCETDQAPPFLWSPVGGGPDSRRRPQRRSRTDPPSPTTASSVWPPAGSCGHAWPVSLCSCPYWLGSVSTPWSVRLAIRAPAWYLRRPPC
jgi:hypothetical protein